MQELLYSIIAPILVGLVLRLVDVLLDRYRNNRK